MSDQVQGLDLSRAIAARPTVRRISLADVTDALRSGVRDFMAMPSHVIFLVIIYPVIGLVLGYVTSDADLMPLFYPLAAGFALLGPIAALGLYEISRRLERGDEVTWRDAFGVLRSPAIGAILELSLLLMVIFVAWLLTANLIFRATVGAVPVGNLLEFLGEMLTTARGWMLILVGNAVGAVFAAAAFTISAVSFPLLLDRKVPLAVAIATSVTAVRANPAPMAAWAVIIAVLMAIGSAFLFIGLAVVLPVLGHATWHLYRKLVDAPAGGRTDLPQRSAAAD